MDVKFKPYQKLILGVVSTGLLSIAVFYSYKLTKMAWPAWQQMNGIFTILGAFTEPILLGIGAIYGFRYIMKVVIGLYRDYVDNLTPWQKAQRFKKFRK